MSFDPIAARRNFPSLHRPSPRGQTPIFFDNPAGTQVTQQTIDGVTRYFLTMNANSGGEFATSKASDAIVEHTRTQAQAFLNAPSAHEIVFGANMTTLNFALSRAIAKTLKAGDEIILTRMDHDANVSPWLRIAQDYGLEVKWVGINTDDCTLNLDSLEAALSEKTRIVATVHASNAAGTINPVSRIAELAHAVGAYHVVDGVQSAPHIPLDVQAIGCDFLMCSSYKFFGPHMGILWGKHDLLESLPAYKVRPSHDESPNRWETGTGLYELMSGLSGTFDYLSSLNADGKPSPAAFLAYEQELAAHLIEVIQNLSGTKIYGITDPARAAERVPTVIFERAGFTPTQIAQHLAANDIYVWNGNYYAVEIMGQLGKQELVRVGLAHYNTHEEIDKLAWVLGKM